LPDQSQAQQSAQTPNTPIAAAGDDSTPFDGDADSQQQKQREAQPIQSKPQEAKATPQAEIAKPTIQPADAATAKLQPIAFPEPVRALGASFNAASLQAANMNDRNPVALNASALAVEIASRMRDGMRRFDIRLDPPELGRIDVRLEVDRAGNVTTKLTLDRPETLDLMQRDARGLERALQQAGLKTDGGGVEFSLRSHADQNPANDQSGRGAHSPDAHAADETARIEVVIEGYRSAAFARGGIDIRI
jgi:chemotaxis protein MotD